MEGRIYGRRGCGRPITMWTDNIKEWTKYDAMTVSEWHKIENDGDPWQPTCWLQMAHNDEWWWLTSIIRYRNPFSKYTEYVVQFVGFWGAGDVKVWQANVVFKQDCCVCFIIIILIHYLLYLSIRLDNFTLSWDPVFSEWSCLQSTVTSYPPGALSNKGCRNSLVWLGNHGIVTSEAGLSKVAEIACLQTKQQSGCWGQG